MRLVVAIGTFVLAFVLLVVGLTFRIFFSSTDYVTESQQVSTSTPYLVIDGAVLAAHEGDPYISATGNGPVVVAYGTAKDVQAWLGGVAYDQLGFEKDSTKYQSTLVPAKATAPVDPKIVNPTGSDMWINEAFAPDVAKVQAKADSNYQVIIASDGKQSAPGNVTIAWPLPSRAPWATTLLIIGGVLALVGLVLYLWALRHLRREHGPRRRGGGSPKPPRGALKASRPKKAIKPSRGRRAILPTLAPVLGVATVLTLGLSACTPLQAAQNGQVATNSANPLAKNNPDVSEVQFARIMARTSATIAEADKTLSVDLAATRLTGPAQQLRAANYAIRGKDGNQAALPTIPAQPISLLMPQATDAWPRIVMAVLQNPNDPSVPTVGVVMIQNSPRENYHVEYAVSLEPNASVPKIAPATVGSTGIPADSKLLLMAPNKVGAAYADILANGSASQFYNSFDLSSDTLAPQIGQEYKQKKIAAIADKATLEFYQSPGSGVPLSLATLDSGAIVSVGLDETERVKPKPGSSVTPEGQAKLLSGLGATSAGFEDTYNLQLVFYVPPIGSKDKIRLLGFTQGLIAVKGL